MEKQPPSLSASRASSRVLLRVVPTAASGFICLPLFLLLLLLLLVVSGGGGGGGGVAEAFQHHQSFHHHHRATIAPASSSLSFLQNNNKKSRTMGCIALNSHPTIGTTAVSAISVMKHGMTTVFGKLLCLIFGSSSSSSIATRLIRGAAFALGAVFFVRNYQNMFDPNAVFRPNNDAEAPLPPRAQSCPFIGNQILVGTKTFGAGYFYHNMSNRLGNPRMWLYSFLGNGGIVMSGGQRLKNFLNREFATSENGGIYAGMKASRILSADSLLSEQNKAKHSALRRLVGAAMTPAAVALSIPTLQAAAETQVSNMLTTTNDAGGAGVVTMEHICTDYTLDVAWKQLLGLDLTDDEIPIFRQAVDTWIKGFTSLRVILNIGAKNDPSIQAKHYLEHLIREKITKLEKNGVPDASTLSGMVFARDDNDDGDGDGDDDSKKKNKKKGVALKLTKEQVVENAFLLILAGSETSASTLTNAMLGLGLHPDSWQKVVQEQRELKKKHNKNMLQASSSSLSSAAASVVDGEEGNDDGRGRFPLTQKKLDQDCPYLDAVVREAMRIKPIPTGVPRFTKETLTIDGYQIPKGWMVNWNVMLTHELDPITYKEDGSHMTMGTGFSPERWLEKTTRPTTDFMPMGAGPRYCLGSTLAYAEMKVFLAVLAQTIDFDLVQAADDADDTTTAASNIVWKRMSIIPKPANGVPVHVRPAIATPTTTTVVTGEEFDSNRQLAVIKEDMCV